MRPPPLRRGQRRSWPLWVVLVGVGLAASTPSAQQAGGAASTSPGASVAFDPRGELAAVRTEERGILDQLGQIDAQLTLVASETLELAAQVEELETQRASHLAAVQDADTRLSELQVGVRRQIWALYRILRQGLAQVLFGADDPRELRRRSRYLTHLVKADVGRLREFQSVRDARQTSLDELDADRSRLDQARTALELKETELREQRAARVELLRQIAETRELQLQAMAEADRASVRFDRALSARTQAVPTDAWAGGLGVSRTSVPTPPSAANTFRESYGRLPWPVRGRLTRRFGKSPDPATGLESQSTGIDIAADFGEPVRAVYRGVVRMAAPIQGRGQTVAIQHGPYTTVYAHLGGIRVRVDDTVNAGQVIGVVGNTGLTAAQGYRLTFEVRYNRSPQDPLPWLTQ